MNNNTTNTAISNQYDVKPISRPASINNNYEKYQEDQYESSLAEEQVEHVPGGTASPGKALFMLLKAFIGTGVIFLPGSYVNQKKNFFFLTFINRLNNFL